MSFFKIPDTFWEIFTAVTGGSTTNLTNAMEAIAQAERTKANSYFANVLDQIPFNTDDYTRIRNFLKDWYATHRTVANLSSHLQDPRSMANNQLDELFRSFGFNYSASLRQASNEPLDSKINFFLDLVNLYKIKGTPRALLEILQYYGIPQVDIYSFWLRLNSSGELEFQGNAVAGTTVDPSPLIVGYNALTTSDPHWLYTSDQIKSLQQTNLINLPSKSPYIGILPIAEVGSETAILVRKIQDQYFEWISTTELPPQNAEINIVGENASLLELYLALIYTYYKEYDVPGSDGTSFICYDGTNTVAADIINEYNNIVNSKVTTRAQYRERLAQYYDTFTRNKSLNFLQAKTTAETILQTINPDLVTALDDVGDPILTVLNSLTKDLANWVRNNIGYGYINIGFMLGGLSAFFSDLRPIINFFKPYRARVFTLEAIVLKNRLFNKMIVEDVFDVTTEHEFRDRILGGMKPCCSDPDLGIICDSTSPSYDFNPRATFDCGGYFDIGAVDDFRNGFYIEEGWDFIDSLRCPIDSTGFIYSEMITSTYTGPNIIRFELGGAQSSFTYTSEEADVNYALIADVYTDENASSARLHDYTILEKKTYGGRIKLSGETNSNRYYASYKRVRTANSGSESVSNGATYKRVEYSGGPIPSSVIDFNSLSGYALSSITVDGDGNLIAYQGSDDTFYKFDGISNTIIDSARPPLGYRSSDGHITYGLSFYNGKLIALQGHSTNYRSQYLEFTWDGTIYKSLELVMSVANPEEKGISYDPIQGVIIGMATEYVSTWSDYRYVWNYSTGAIIRRVRCRNDAGSTTNGAYLECYIDYSQGYLYAINKISGRLDYWDYNDTSEYVIDSIDFGETTIDGLEFYRGSSNQLLLLRSVNTPRELIVYSGTGDPLAVNLSNYIDSPSIVNTYKIMITQVDFAGFTVDFSAPVNTGNYTLEWAVHDETASGLVTVEVGVEGVTIELPTTQDNPYYAVFVDLINTVDATATFLSYIVTEKTKTDFYVKFSIPTPTANYVISWAIVPQDVEFDSYRYFQSGEFRPFDNDAKYDCTHGFDRIEIEFSTVGYYLLKQDGGFLLQHDNSKIKLESSP